MPYYPTYEDGFLEVNKMCNELELAYLWSQIRYDKDTDVLSLDADEEPA